ncbi:MAG: DUF1700 domain-containing protein [Clostridia bacterium]|nr:DUF1700 domain-containing protein [Clostridia bacterium]
MGKEEYIAEIKKELGFMPYNEVVKAEEYFNSFFCGTQSDEEVINTLGTPKEAAKKYCKSNTEEEKNNQNRINKARNYTGWVIAIIAAVFLFPVWAPVLLISAAFVVFIMVMAVAVSFGTWIGGGVAIITGIFSNMIIADKLIQCGLGFVMFGVGLMLSWLLVWGLINLSIWFIRKVTKS